MVPVDVHLRLDVTVTQVEIPTTPHRLIKLDERASLE